uniref:Uncharacterized protein n=1 Tax=Arundo donax TaxID=35708 RepID=A0A0A9GUY9_ARUDO
MNNGIAATWKQGPSRPGQESGRLRGLLRLVDGSSVGWSKPHRRAPKFSPCWMEQILSNRYLLGQVGRPKLKSHVTCMRLVAVTDEMRLPSLLLSSVVSTIILQCLTICRLHHVLFSFTTSS